MSLTEPLVNDILKLINDFKLSNVTLGICGTSGVGKTYLIESLIEKYPELFNRVEQVTTRAPRTHEADHYNFISNRIYDKFLENELLTAKTSVDDKRYGSLLWTFVPDKVNILALNTKGLLDIKNDSRSNIIFFSLGLIKLNPPSKDIKGRENRNIAAEATFGEHVDTLRNLRPYEYISEENALMDLKVMLSNYCTIHNEKKITE